MRRKKCLQGLGVEAISEIDVAIMMMTVNNNRRYYFTVGNFIFSDTDKLKVKVRDIG